MQTLTLEAVQKAARRAYRAGKLTAQHPRAGDRRCVYEVGQYHCGIGAALTERSIKETRKFKDGISGSVAWLRHHKIIDIKKSERRSIYAIQRAHDNWAVKSRVSLDTKMIAACEAKFCKLIGISYAA